MQEVTPALRPAALATGLAVSDHPLLVLSSPAPAGAPTADVHAVGPDDDLPAVLSAAHVGFGQPGTAAGPAGLAERTTTTDRAASEVDAERRDLRAGTAVRYAAWVDGAPVCPGGSRPSMASPRSWESGRCRRTAAGGWAPPSPPPSPPKR